ncbi:hypothetical protein P3L10_028746 [Capsicum annuum]
MSQPTKKLFEMPSVQIQLKDCASPSKMKKKKIDRIESQPKSKSMSESPSSSHRMTLSQSQRLLGACKDEEKDISKGKEKVWDSVVRPSDYYMTHVSVHTNCSIVNELKDKFTKVQLDLFRNTCFGYFSDLPPVCIQNQLIHGMLLRKVLSSRSDEIWIQVNETKLQFGLSEFAVISGLKCTFDVTLACNLSQSSRLMNLYFPNQSKVTKLEMKKKFLGKKWQSDGDALHIVILYFVHSFLFSITYGDFINKDDFLLVESGQFETFPWEKLCFLDMLDSMKYQIYKQKSMYRRGGFSLAFQCWFYECCPYANDKLVVRVRDSVPRVLNWSVTVRSNYRKVKFSFSDIHREQVVLTNIESTCIEKSILQLPVFEPVPQKEHTAFKKSDGLSDPRKEHMREDIHVNSQNENPIEINLSDNVGRQTDGTPKVDHVSDNVVDSVGQKNVGVDNCIDVEAGNKLSANLVDDVEKENINYMKDLIENSQEIDWSVVPDSEISKYTQPDKIGEHFMIEKVLGKIDTDLGSTSVALVATEVFVDIGSVVPRRIRKSAAICESPYLSKFDLGCSNVQGQPTKCIDKGPSRKHIFSIKHPFIISITEPFLDIKLLSSFNKFVDKPLRLNSKMFLGKRKDVATIKEDSEIVEYILGYVMRDCGVFAAAFAEYMIEGIQIPVSLDDIDSIQSRYGALLWQYGKTK